MDSIKLLLNKLAEKMKKNKRLELIVYVLLAALGILIYSFAFSGSNSADENKTQTSIQSSTETETRLERILSTIDGAGRVEVMVAENGENTGVIVVAQGASDIGVMLKLKSAAATVLGISDAQVEVFQMNEEKKDE